MTGQKKSCKQQEDILLDSGKDQEGGPQADLPPWHMAGHQTKRGR